MHRITSHPRLWRSLLQSRQTSFPNLTRIYHDWNGFKILQKQTPHHMDHADLLFKSAKAVRVVLIDTFAGSEPLTGVEGAKD